MDDDDDDDDYDCDYDNLSVHCINVTNVDVPHPHAQERYTGQTFKVAKALRSKLNSMQILKQWEDFFGEWTDFLAPEINNGRILAVMNELGVMIESYTCGQSAAYQGLIFMELAKMCVLSLVVPNTTDFDFDYYLFFSQGEL